MSSEPFDHVNGQQIVTPSRARGHLASIALATAVATLLAGVVVGLLAADQFRDTIQHTASPCTPATDGPAGPTTLAWIALTINLVGLLLAAIAGIVGGRRVSPRQSVLVLASTIAAVSSVLAMLANVFVLYAVSTCAPYAGS